jgi:hypothetical protein
MNMNTLPRIYLINNYFNLYNFFDPFAAYSLIFLNALISPLVEESWLLTG